MRPGTKHATAERRHGTVRFAVCAQRAELVLGIRQRGDRAKSLELERSFKQGRRRRTKCLRLGRRLGAYRRSPGRAFLRRRRAAKNLAGNSAVVGHDQLAVWIHHMAQKRSRTKTLHRWHSDSDAEHLHAGISGERKSHIAELHSHVQLQGIEHWRCTGRYVTSSFNVYGPAYVSGARPQMVILEYLVPVL